MSTIQINLVPNSKYDQVQSVKKRNLLFRVSFLATAALVGIFLLLLFTTEVVQKKQLNDADKNAAAAEVKLSGTNNLNQILTIQNQLTSLPNLHLSKHVTSRLAGYLNVVTPASVKISSVTLDLTANSLKLSGTTDSQHSVNVFVDTLKFTTYTTGSGTQAKKAFPSVVESNFGISNNTATYELDITFDPTLFANNLVDSDGKSVTPSLNVPTLTTTRADDASNNLFNGQAGQR